MWPESEGGRRRGWTPPSSCSPPPPNISLTHSKKGAMCFVDIYLFNPEVKGHLFMSPFQAHKKWDNWVKQGCRILLLCDGLQVIPTELFKGGGGWGEIKKLKLKKNWFETLIYMYTHHMIIRLNMWKLVYDIFFMSCFIILNIT